ncbi:MAG TPA: GNAT family N-acetyltransferase [Chitinophagaceae bacterium]|nr:GNAT family N-acetyltransferase [Chitinophagaceae bacterium]
MLEFNFHPFPNISTERLALRKISEDDMEEIYFLRSDRQVLQFLDRDPIRSIDDATQWIQMIDEGIRTNQYIAWAITLKNEQKLIGTISFWNVKKEHHRAEIGYALHPLFQGKGLMQEAMTPVLDYGFKQMKLHSVEANVNPNNVASIKLLEKNNFVREAYHKENYYYNGKFLDSAIYSLLTPY